jgi:hypothetical protein
MFLPFISGAAVSSRTHLTRPTLHYPARVYLTMTILAVLVRQPDSVWTRSLW